MNKTFIILKSKLQPIALNNKLHVIKEQNWANHLFIFYMFDMQHKNSFSFLCSKAYSKIFNTFRI